MIKYNKLTKSFSSKLGFEDLSSKFQDAKLFKEDLFIGKLFIDMTDYFDDGEVHESTYNTSSLDDIESIITEINYKYDNIFKSAEFDEPPYLITLVPEELLSDYVPASKTQNGIPTGTYIIVDYIECKIQVASQNILK